MAVTPDRDALEALFDDEAIPPVAAAPPVLAPAPAPPKPPAPPVKKPPMAPVAAPAQQRAVQPAPLRPPRPQPAAAKPPSAAAAAPPPRPEVPIPTGTGTLLRLLRWQMEAAANRLTHRTMHEGIFFTARKDLQGLRHTVTGAPYPPNVVNMQLVLRKIWTEYTSPYQMLADIVLMCRNVLEFCTTELEGNYRAYARQLEDKARRVVDGIIADVAADERAHGVEARNLRATAAAALRRHPLAAEFQSFPLQTAATSVARPQPSPAARSRALPAPVPLSSGASGEGEEDDDDLTRQRNPRTALDIQPSFQDEVDSPRPSRPKILTRKRPRDEAAAPAPPPAPRAPGRASGGTLLRPVSSPVRLRGRQSTSRLWGTLAPAQAAASPAPRPPPRVRVVDDFVDDLAEFFGDPPEAAAKPARVRRPPPPRPQADEFGFDMSEDGEPEGRGSGSEPSGPSAEPKPKAPAGGPVVSSKPQVLSGLAPWNATWMGEPPKTSLLWVTADVAGAPIDTVRLASEGGLWNVTLDPVQRTLTAYPKSGHWVSVTPDGSIKAGTTRHVDQISEEGSKAAVRGVVARIQQALRVLRDPLTNLRLSNWRVINLVAYWRLKEPVRLPAVEEALKEVEKEQVFGDLPLDIQVKTGVVSCKLPEPFRMTIRVRTTGAVELRGAWQTSHVLLVCKLLHERLIPLDLKQLN
eukprot:Hpha_TRINITY_DN14571_c1_g1::TRINITY_DN14571_c1_g1_i1::g.47076::m.47076